MKNESSSGSTTTINAFAIPEHDLVVLSNEKEFAIYDVKQRNIIKTQQEYENAIHNKIAKSYS